MDDNLLAESVRKVGISKGLNNAQINKAIKLIKSGKINTDDLFDSMIDESLNLKTENLTREELKERLHAKIKKTKNLRLNKSLNGPTKENANEKPNENPNENTKNKEKSAREKKRAQMKKLKKKYGIISEELYNSSLEELHKISLEESHRFLKGNLTEQEQNNKNRLQNIVDLYIKQSKNNKLDELNLDDYSDISD